MMERWYANSQLCGSKVMNKTFSELIVGCRTTASERLNVLVEVVIAYTALKHENW